MKTETLDSLFNEYERECEAKYQVEMLLKKIKEDTEAAGD